MVVQNEIFSVLMNRMHFSTDHSLQFSYFHLKYIDSATDVYFKRVLRKKNSTGMRVKIIEP
jgi:hypothetical protein